jgi:hypothetical protein
VDFLARSRYPSPSSASCTAMYHHFGDLARVPLRHCYMWHPLYDQDELLCDASNMRENLSEPTRHLVVPISLRGRLQLRQLDNSRHTSLLRSSLLLWGRMLPHGVFKPLPARIGAIGLLLFSVSPKTHPSKTNDAALPASALLCPAHNVAVSRDAELAPDRGSGLRGSRTRSSIGLFHTRRRIQCRMVRISVYRAISGAEKAIAFPVFRGCRTRGSGSRQRAKYE